MVITRISLTNWCQHESLEVDFSLKSTGILGNNGAGKTNLTKAILVALTGRTEGGSTLEDEIREGEDSARIELSFVHDGCPGIIKRRFYRTSTNRASIIWGETDINSIKETNLQIGILTQASPEMMEKFSFIGQDALRAVLFDTPSKRMEQLISMIPAIAYTKLYRGRVEAFLKTIPNISLPYDYEHVLGKIKEYSDFGVELASEFASVLTKLQTCGDCEEHSALLMDHELFLAAEKQMEAQAVAIKEREVNLVPAQEALEAAEAVPVPTVPEGFDIGDARDTIRIYYAFDFDRYQNWIEDHDAAANSKRRLDSDIAHLEVQLDEVKVSCADKLTIVGSKSETFAIAAHSYSIWEGIQEDQLSCPVCGTDLSPGEMEESKSKDSDELERSKKDLDVATAAYESIIELIAETEFELTTMKEESRVLQATIIRADGFLSSCSTPEMGSDEVNNLELEVKAYEDREGVTANIDACKRVVLTIQSELTLLQGTTLGNNFTGATPEQLKESQAALASKASLDLSRDRLLSQMSSSNEELLKFQKMLLEVEAAIESKANVDAYRESVIAVRDLMHRDKLPKIVLRFYLDSMRRELNGYLKAFGASFSVRVDDDFNIFFTKNGGEERGINRLSGGEKTVLSISLHLCISELFGNGLGLLVLDEPTSNMDVEYLNQFARIVETLSSGILGGDRQLVVVTHQASQLSGVFDKVIKLGYN